MKAKDSFPFVMNLHYKRDLKGDWYKINFNGQSLKVTDKEKQLLECGYQEGKNERN